MPPDVTEIILRKFEQLETKLDDMAKKLTSANTEAVWHRLKEHGEKIAKHDLQFAQQRGGLAVLSVVAGAVGTALAWGGEHLFSHR